MKNLLKNHLLILTVFVLLCVNVKGQDERREALSFDFTLKRQADSLKESLTHKGFIVVREAMMAMESEYEMPVIVPLNEGTRYQFVFIGDMSSKLYELRMYDQNEKQETYQKHYGDGIESNVISFSYIPKFTEYHLIKPVQMNKKKNIYGCIIIFKKVT